MTHKDNKVTAIKSNDSGTYICIGYQHGKVEFWEKNNNFFHLKWETRYTCLPVLHLEFFRNYLVVIEKGWQLFFQEPDTGFIFKSVIIDFNVYANCCPLQIVNAAVNQKHLLLSSVNGPVHVLDLDCLLHKEANPVLNLLKYNHYLDANESMDFAHFQKNQPCLSQLGKLTGIDDINQLIISADGKFAYAINGEGCFAEWKLQELENEGLLSCNFLHFLPSFEPFPNVVISPLDEPAANYLVACGNINGHGYMQLWDMNSLVLLNHQRSPLFSNIRNVTCAGRSFIIAQTTKDFILIEVSNNFMNAIAKVEKTSSQGFIPGYQFADSMDANNIALALTNEVLFIDIYSNTVNSLKNHVHVTMHSLDTVIPAAGNTVHS